MFFTVKNNYKIGNKSYRPCVCYDLTDELFNSVKDLEKVGKAEITDKPVFFQNGKKLEVKHEDVPEVKGQKKAKKVKSENENLLSEEDKELTEGF